MITSQIREAATIQELLRMHREHKSSLDHIHLSACWTSLAQLAEKKPENWCWLRMHVDALDLLVQHTANAARAGEIGAR